MQPFPRPSIGASASNLAGHVAHRVAFRFVITMPGKPLSEDEVRLAKDWYMNEDMKPSAIGEQLKCDRSTINHLIADKFKKKKTGRKVIMLRGWPCEHAGAMVALTTSLCWK